MEAAQRAKSLQRTLVVIGDTAGPIPGVLTNSVVVFVSCVLEYVGDLPAALQEIQSIAGDLENIFIVTVHPGAQWAGIADKHVVAMARVTTTHKAIAAGVLAGASLLALWPARPKEEPP